MIQIKAGVAGCLAATWLNDRHIAGEMLWTSRNVSFDQVQQVSVGKAGCLAALAAMPVNVRARAPAGRMLEWHQMKLVAGQLIAAAPFGAPILATRFVTMPVSARLATPGR